MFDYQGQDLLKISEAAQYFKVDKSDIWALYEQALIDIEEDPVTMEMWVRKAEIAKYIDSNNNGKSCNSLEWKGVDHE